MKQWDVSESVHACGCFVKVHVCPRHIEAAGAELRDLTAQLNLGILDTMVSVSASVEGEGNDASR